MRRFLELPSPLGERFLYRAILRFAGKPEAVREVLCFLAGLGFDAPEPARKPWLVVPWFQVRAPEKYEFKPQHPALQQRLAARRVLEAGEGMPREILFGLRGTYHRQASKQLVRRLSAAEPRRGRMDGPLTAALKEALSATGRPQSLAEIVANQNGASGNCLRSINRLRSCWTYPSRRFRRASGCITRPPWAWPWSDCWSDA